MATTHRLLLRQSPFWAAATRYQRQGSASQHGNLSRRFFSANKGHLQEVYVGMAKKEGIHQDEHQLKALNELDRLYEDLQEFKMPPQSSSAPPKKESSSIWGMFSSKSEPNSPPVISAPKGVYIHGGVGSGKTFCMNLFHDNLPGTDKQQVHFHKFMLRDVHQQLHELKKHSEKGADVMSGVVTSILERGRVICFDEFQVTDVADAMMLKKLFTSLLEQGAVVVATSNRPPQDLYLGGLQRDRFLPFIALLEERLNVVSMWDSETDYRLIATKEKGVYFIGKEQKKEFEEVFHTLTKDSSVVSTNLSTQGRLVPIPRASVAKGVARFSFEDLCTKALGAADYLVIGQHFHTVFVDNIPALNRSQINWVRRLIIFVDSMYECHVKLVVQAQTEPDGIFTVDLDDASNDEVFAFDRTRSRLEEMRSQQYLKKRWAGAGDMSQAKADLSVEPSLSESAVGA